VFRGDIHVASFDDQIDPLMNQEPSAVGKQNVDPRRLLSGESFAKLQQQHKAKSEVTHR
jgi:hypothetical protein